MYYTIKLCLLLIEILALRCKSEWFVGNELVNLFFFFVAIALMSTEFKFIITIKIITSLKFDETIKTKRSNLYVKYLRKG